MINWLHYSWGACMINQFKGKNVQYGGEEVGGFLLFSCSHVQPSVPRTVLSMLERHPNTGNMAELMGLAWH